ncbi:MAG: hypothetical protein ACK5UM_02860 [Pseudomonadota bacterium]|jgi:hypothetical protein|nr:hypothetical protein [Burkholderiaceae bacterium]MCZ8176553.1 hypothetical protein [Burkholderiaceae bacterium]
MSQQAPSRNPFMLMTNPEVVFAAVEKSERLGQLSRHLCRPLDRPSPGTAGRPAVPDDDSDIVAADAAD